MSHMDFIFILVYFYAEWDTGWVGGPEVILEVHETMTNSPNPIVVNDTSIPTGNFSSFYCIFFVLKNQQKFSIKSYLVMTMPKYFTSVTYNML